MNELGGNVESVVYYRKVQENGAFIKIECSRTGTLRSCFYAVMVHNNIERIEALLQR